MLSATASKLSLIARANGPAIIKMATRAMATKINDLDRMIALCKANSEVLGRNIKVIDNLIERKQVSGANEIYTQEWAGTTLGRQFRHELCRLQSQVMDLRGVGSEDPPDSGAEPSGSAGPGGFDAVLISDYAKGVCTRP